MYTLLPAISFVYAVEFQILDLPDSCWFWSIHFHNLKTILEVLETVCVMQHIFFAFKK